MAYVGTLTGAMVAFCAQFRRFAQSHRQRRGCAFVVRRLLEFCRTVPDIVFALIFVVAFGLGPLPGVLALAIHSAGALGKQFSEASENIDMKPVEGVRSAGAPGVAAMRFGALPQVIAEFRQLRAAALRDQRARRGGARLRRRRRHRPGSDGGDPEVLLFRCQRDPGHDHRGGDDDRHLDPISAHALLSESR